MNGNQNKRIEGVDVLKGILTILVIVGHAEKIYPNGIIQLIYWFHMPGFFMVTGYLFQNVVDIKVWVKNKIIRLLIPHTMWFIVLSILYGNIDTNKMLRFLLGARNLGGVYWYIPCLFCAILLFIILETRLDKRMRIFGYFIIYFFVCFDSFKCNYFEKDDISFSVGAMCIACIYIAIGYYMKNRISILKNKHIIIVSMLFVLSMIVLYKSDVYKYNMNIAEMKFGTPILNIVIPYCAIIVLTYISELSIFNGSFKRLLADIGKGSLIIMYFHKPLLTDVIEKHLGTEGFMWILNVFLTLTASYVVYKIIFHSRILAFLFGGSKIK